MPWLQAHLEVEREQAALIEDVFRTLGAISITFGDAADEALLEPSPGESPLWSKTLVSALFAPETRKESVRQALNLSLSEDPGAELRFEFLEDQVWERAWLDDFRPMLFGRRLWVCPDGQRPPQPGGTIIDLDPGLAFGTGTHPTTSLCLEWLDRHAPTKDIVIDYGCGSGILAVAALKLGAHSAVAVDHDHQALEATLENARKNGVTDRLRLYHSTEVPAITADLVLANILAGTLISLEPVLASMLRPGGVAVLSGILSDQAQQVITAFSTDFEICAQITLEEWLLLEARRR